MSAYTLIYVSLALFTAGLIFLFWELSRPQREERRAAAEMDRLEAELNESSKAAEDLVKQKALLKKEADELKTANSILRDEMEDVKTDMERVAREEARRSESIRKLTGEFDSEEAMVREIGRLRDEVVGLNIRVEERRGSAEDREEQTQEMMARMEALKDRLGQETEVRRTGEQVIESLRKHIKLLEKEREQERAVSLKRRSGAAGIASGIEELRKVAQEQRSASRGIKEHIEEVKAKYRI